MTGSCYTSQTLVDRCTDPDPWERPAFNEVAGALRGMIAKA